MRQNRDFMSDFKSRYRALRSARKERDLTFIPMASAVRTFATWPNLSELPLLSLRHNTGTCLVLARVGMCFVNHLGLQSAAIRTAYSTTKEMWLIFSFSDWHAGIADMDICNTWNHLTFCSWLNLAVNYSLINSIICWCNIQNWVHLTVACAAQVFTLSRWWIYLVHDFTLRS